MLGLFSKGGLKLPPKLIEWATSSITGYLEDLRNDYPEKNPNLHPIWINIYNKIKHVEGEEEKHTIIAYTAISPEGFIVLEKHNPMSLTAKNKMIGMLAPMVTGLLSKIEAEQNEPVTMSILNDYENEKPETVIRFIKQSNGEVVKQIGIGELGNA